MVSFFTMSKNSTRVSCHFFVCTKKLFFPAPNWIPFLYGVWWDCKHKLQNSAYAGVA